MKRPASILVPYIGLVDTLERMGHEALAVPIAGTEKSIRRGGRVAAQLAHSTYPTSAELRDCEGIFLCERVHQLHRLSERSRGSSAPGNRGPPLTIGPMRRY